MKRHALINHYYAYALMHTLVKAKKKADSSIPELITEYFNTHKTETPNLNFNLCDFNRRPILCLKNSPLFLSSPDSGGSSSGMVFPTTITVDFPDNYGKVVPKKYHLQEESSLTEQTDEPLLEVKPVCETEKYAHWVETSNSFPKIGKELVSLAETARTKAGFVRSLHDRTETEIDPLFKFKKEYRTNKCRAEFVNYMLQTYGYTGKKKFVDDDFQRIYTFKPKSKR